MASIERDLRIGVVGTGRIASIITRVIAGMSGVRVEAVCSKDRIRAEQFASAHHVSRACADLDELCSLKELDLVYIANETSQHARSSLTALNAGKAVLCEKPLAISEAQGREVVELAKKNGQLLVEALWTLCLPSYRRAIDLAQDPSLGSPIHLTADFGYPVTARENASLFASEGGGVLLDRSVYLISLALKLFGPVKDVQASALIDADGIDVHSSVTLVHDRSATSQLAASFVALMPNVATISCSRGTIRIEEPLVGSEGLRIMAAPNSGAVAGSADASFRSALKRGLKTSALLRRVKRRLGTGISETHSYGSNQYVPFLEHVFDLVRSGKSQSQAIPLDLSLEVLNIVDRARRCHIGNGWNP